MTGARQRNPGRIWVVVTLLATAILVVLGIMSFHEGTARSKPVVPPFDLFWCAKDDDCAVVDRIGCCPCSLGGAQAAVTKWHRDNLRRFLKSACRPRQVCVQLDLCRRDIASRCIDRHCELAPAAK